MLSTCMKMWPIKDDLVDSSQLPFRSTSPVRNEQRQDVVIIEEVAMAVARN